MSSQQMKPATAAKKLEIYLPATPEEFQNSSISREELAELQSNPPAWLTELRENGPHPRSVVANRLGVSASGLARAGVSDSMTTAEIDQIRADEPEWLAVERVRQNRVRKETVETLAKKREQRAAQENSGN
ncbi:MAG: DUF5997 family protein [Mycetocola sp.]